MINGKIEQSLDPDSFKLWLEHPLPPESSQTAEAAEPAEPSLLRQLVTLPCNIGKIAMRGDLMEALKESANHLS